MFYSPSARGFYSKKVHKNIPSDAIEIAPAEHKKLLRGEAQGKIITIANGSIVLSNKPDISIKEHANAAKQRINAARDAALADGLPRDIAGEPDVVQTRPQDQINLLGLRAKAKSALDEGITEPVMKFRGEKNVTRYLTPDEMYTLTNDALAHIESIYDHSWERKDAIEVALEAEDRQSINSISW
ncbi:DUF4376 domain-containing protein [Halomonas sp. G11]|uniref:DUF4376 domain-containing protein n=1 Tax=Halomonas sp. G11 TaxID=1684425 RepID=UPI0007FC844E|nr:DUF4376 domain-containing protein [Halomonas sp. G11]OAZ99751.1 hypothetical protein ADS46_13175 [Halomonas sp. G11]